ncbi:hypothetical protein ABT024_07060 [Streptomyces sp. NPDC002812]|uniref:hypothetical protein n=1 Tax=Streptomyces sp. NPDC002812 TaxID=3154434 RepID=UPI00331B0529
MPTVPTPHDHALPAETLDEKDARLTADSRSRRTACRHCGAPAEWIDCPHAGGWWAHEQHPTDGHDAEPAE